MLIEVLRDLFRRFLQRDVHNARLPNAFAHPLHQALALGSTRDRLNPQVEVGSIETRGNNV